MKIALAGAGYWEPHSSHFVQHRGSLRLIAHPTLHPDTTMLVKAPTLQPKRKNDDDD